MYLKTTWLERLGVKLNRFAKVGETGSYVELTNDPESVTQAGTAFTTERMNNIEDGIEALNSAVSADTRPDLLVGLSQTSRAWAAMTTNGIDVYACDASGDIYKQTGGTGDFIALGQTSRQWTGLAARGVDIYACVVGGDIYKQTGGVGDFVALGQATRYWQAMASDGVDVYAVVPSSDIYKQTGGTGDFVALGQIAYNWYGITILDNDVYASVSNGDIYKQTNKSGDFIALNQPSRAWNEMTTNGTDVYVIVTGGGDIYKQTGGTGDFVALGQTSRQWTGITILDNDVYASVSNGDIYKQSLAFSHTIGNEHTVLLDQDLTGTITVPDTFTVDDEKVFIKTVTGSSAVSVSLSGSDTFINGETEMVIEKRAKIKKISSTIWDIEYPEVLYYNFDISSANQSLILPAPAASIGKQIRISWSGGDGTYKLTIVGTINDYSSWEGLGEGSLTIVSDGSSWTTITDGVFDTYYTDTVSGIVDKRKVEWFVNGTYHERAFVQYANGLTNITFLYFDTITKRPYMVQTAPTNDTSPSDVYTWVNPDTTTQCVIYLRGAGWTTQNNHVWIEIDGTWR